MRVLGHVQRVKTIYPAEVRPVTTQQERTHEPDMHTIQGSLPKDNQSATLPTPEEKLWDPPVCIDHLRPEQQPKVRQLLREESGAFAQDDSDVGCIPSLQLRIRLHDTTPVKHTYMSVPKPLHKEVKEYLEVK